MEKSSAQHSMCIFHHEKEGRAGARCAETDLRNTVEGGQLPRETAWRMCDVSRTGRPSETGGGLVLTWSWGWRSGGGLVEGLEVSSRANKSSWWHNSVKLLKAAEWCTLNGWYVKLSLNKAVKNSP